jgi:tyrosyl-tRNA synthetase
MQGWDSVMVEADVELGGTDQTFNNLVGRDLQCGQGKAPQIVIIMEILVGTDGRQKMSKSLNNYIGLADSAVDQFGKVMSIPDAMMGQWFRLCTPLRSDRIASLLDAGTTHPRDAKDILGRVIVEQFHSAEAAEAAAEDFRRRFADGGLPAEVEVRTIASAMLQDGKIGLLTLIKEIGFTNSTSESRRMVESGAVSFGGQKISDPRIHVSLDGDPVLQVGKRRVCRIRVV